MGVVFAGIVGSVLAAGAMLRVGAALQAGGLAAAAVADGLWTWILGFAIVGLGFGVTEVLASSVTARADPSGRWLSQLGAAFALSAIATPLAVSWSVATLGGVGPVYLLLVLVQTTIALAPGRSGTRGQDRQPNSAPAQRVDGTPGEPTAAGWLTTVLLVMLVTTYVGAEALLSTWTTPITGQLLRLPPAAAAWGATGFWVALAIRRVAAARWLGRSPPERVLRVALLVATVMLGSAAAASGPLPWLAMVLVGGAVVAMGPVYALALTLAGVAGGHAPWAVARPILVGAVGGLIAPAAVVWFVGTDPAAVLRATSMLLAVAALVAAWPRARRPTPT